MEFYICRCIINIKAKSNDGVDASATKFDNDDEYEEINIVNIKF